MSTSDPNAARFQPSAPTSPGSILRSEFDKLTPADQFRAIRENWKVVDDPETARKPVTITKQAFDKMPPEGQRMYLSRGGTVARMSDDTLTPKPSVTHSADSTSAPRVAFTKRDVSLIDLEDGQ